MNSQDYDIIPQGDGSILLKPRKPKEWLHALEISMFLLPTTSIASPQDHLSNLLRLFILNI